MRHSGDCNLCESNKDLNQDFFRDFSIGSLTKFITNKREARKLNDMQKNFADPAQDTFFSDYECIKIAAL